MSWSNAVTDLGNYTIPDQYADWVRQTARTPDELHTVDQCGLMQALESTCPCDACRPQWGTRLSMTDTSMAQAHRIWPHEKDKHTEPTPAMTAVTIPRATG